MKIKKVEWRNFFSYGNKKQTLEFPDDHSLIQVTGGNGFGKSSISQIIIFALYGKVEGKKLKDIPNRINGNAWARIELSTQSGKVVIERGLEPNVFKLLIDGVEYDQAGKKSIQEYITDDIIGIPFYVFNNTILLSINDFKSFIKMGVADKRAIIDRIFGFQILNQMRDILKDEMRKVKSESENLNGELNSTMRSLESSLNELESASQEISQKSDEKITELQQQLTNFESLNELHNKKINDFKAQEKELLSNITKANSSVIQTQLAIKNQKSRLDLYNQDKCPTCQSSLNGEFHDSMKNSIVESITDLESTLESSSSLLDDLEGQQKKVDEFKLDMSQKGQRIRAKIQSVIDQINSEKSKSETPELSSLKRLVESMEETKNQIEAKKLKIGEKGIWLKTLDEILGERGIKQLAIKSVLPTLNSQIQELLMEMGLAYRVVFNDEFDAVLTHMGMEISISSLSTGEMKKVDFAVLMAIVRLMKIKFSGLNLLFLDEIFSSVDPEGVQSILKILRQNAKDLGLNIFVINHAPMPHEVFDYQLEVRKDNNFSHAELKN